MKIQHKSALIMALVFLNGPSTQPQKYARQSSLSYILKRINIKINSHITFSIYQAQPPMFQYE